MRLTLVLVSLFLMISVLSYTFAFLYLRHDLDGELKSTLRAEMNSFTKSDSGLGLDEMLKAKIANKNPELEIISFVGNKQSLANASIPSLSEGFQVIHIDSADASLADSYLVLTETLRQGRLTLGRSLHQLDDLGETFLNLFLMSFIPTLLASFIVGVWLARRSSQRLSQIGSTLDLIAGGDLTARVPNSNQNLGDLDNVAERVNQMAQSQEYSVSALKQVSADIAHDLKTPIQRVSVLLERAKNHLGDNHTANELLSEAVSETYNIQNTFQALLQIAQIEGGSPRSRFKIINLCQIARTVFELYEPVADDRSQTISLELDDENIQVLGDGTLLTQALINLVENALRHTEPQTDIILGISKCPQGCTIIVSDNGPGIPESERENVLKRLYRLEKSRTTSGNGLGLSLVAAITKLHGANLELSDNSPGLCIAIHFRANI